MTRDVVHHQPTPTTAEGADHAATGEEPARNSVGLLADPVFGPFFGGRLLATVGVWVFNIVAAIVVWDLTESALMVGGISVALFAPQLALAPYSGARTDQGDPRLQLVAGRMLIATGSGALAVTLAVLGVDGLPGAWPVLAASLLVGLGFVVGGPAQNSLLPTLVRPSELSRAVALNILPPTLSRAAGPVLGAVLAVTVRPAVAFTITAIANVVFGIILVRLPLRDRTAKASRRDGTVRAGLSYLRGDPTVGSLLTGTVAVGIGADPVITLTPALADHFGRGDTLVAILASAFGVGSVLGFTVLRQAQVRWGVGPVGTAGLAALGGGTLVVALAHVPAVAVVGFLVGGVGFTWALTGLTTQLYEQVPETLRGRIMALWMIAFVGSRPLAAAVSGAMVDATSIAGGFTLVAAAIALLTLVAEAGRRRAIPTTPA